MGFMDSLNTSASGMTAERLRMDVISNNLANASTTRSANGQPFRRQMVMLAPGETNFASTLAAFDHSNSYAGILSTEQASQLGGVKATGIVDDQTPFKQVYDPGNPDANPQGYVLMPNVNVITEMVDMMGATRAYEADVTAVNSAKGMAQKALEIGKA
jgi:flagellar basal-body rod protein FlgC